MDDIFLNEFRPPDDSMIEFILSTSMALNVIAQNEDLADSSREVIERASHSIKVMLAMAVGGHALFVNESSHADALASLAGQLYDRLLLSGLLDGQSIDIAALQNFHEYRQEGPDVSGLFGGKDN